ncbi:MAG: hypothetical protein KDF63_16640, partial [Rhodoferax sp.]|nr:hypothetical protein [Rhodoferax sp.]
MATARSAVVPAAGTPGAQPVDRDAAPDGEPAIERRRIPREIDHLRALAVQTPASLAGNAIGLTLLGAIFWPLAGRGAMLAWLGCGVLLWLMRLAHHWRYRRAS